MGKGVKKDEAYHTALEAFYRRAAADETKTKHDQMAKDALITSDEVVVATNIVEDDVLISIPGKPWTEAFMREEIGRAHV